MTPLTMPAETGRPVLTQGEGKRTTAHLNLTRTMEAQIAAEVAQKERFCTYGRKIARKPVPPQPRIRIQGSPMEARP